MVPPLLSLAVELVPPLPDKVPPFDAGPPPSSSLEPHDALDAKTIDRIKLEATRVLFIVRFSMASDADLPG
ncbi:hypothetical protein ACFL5O_11255 [Myxococcota bacterium]